MTECVNGLQEGMKEHYALGKYFRRRYIEGQPYRLMSEAYDRHQVSCLVAELILDWRLFELYCIMVHCVCVACWLLKCLAVSC